MFKNIRMLKMPIRLASAFLIGLLFSCAEIFSLPAPLAAVIPILLPPIYGAASCVGIFLGGALRLSASAIPLCAAAGTSLLFRIKSGATYSKKSRFTASAFTSAIYLMTSAALSAFSGGGVGDIFRAAVFSAILFAASFLISGTAAALSSEKELSAFETLFSLAICVCALCPARIGAFSFGGTAASVFMLTAAVRKGPICASAVSAVCALGAGISDPTLFSDYAILGVCAVICGALFFASPIKAASSSVLIFIPLAVLFGADDSSIELILDVTVGAAVFSAAYRPISSFADRFAPDDHLPIPKSRVESLCFEAETLSERISCRSEPLKKRRLGDAVYSKLCLSCPQNSECFDGKKAHEGLSKLDSLTSADLAEICRLLPYCSKAADVRRVCDETLRREKYLGSKAEERRVSLRLCAEMMSALSLAVADARRLCSSPEDRLLSKRLRLSLRRRGVKFRSCTVFSGGSAELSFAGSARINETKITSAVSETVGRQFSPPERRELSESVVLRFEPSGEYTFEAGSCQLPAEAEASGDVAETFTCGQFSYLILSDGMGVGREANSSARVLVGLLREFIFAGFSVPTAVALSSSVMTASSPEESFATLDILRLNIHTGAAEVFKAGAFTSYLFADGAESLLKGGGFPVGILEKSDMKIHRFFVRESAVIVMMTDGASAIDTRLCSNAVEVSKALPSRELAEALLAGSHPEKIARRDDISVAVVKIERKRV